VWYVCVCVCVSVGRLILCGLETPTMKHPILTWAVESQKRKTKIYTEFRNRSLTVSKHVEDVGDERQHYS